MFHYLFWYNKSQSHLFLIQLETAMQDFGNSDKRKSMTKSFRKKKESIFVTVDPHIKTKRY